MFGYFDYIKCLLVTSICISTTFAQETNTSGKNVEIIHDPLKMLMQEHDEATFIAVQNSEDFNRYYQYWFDRYAKAIEHNPDSPFLRTAKIKHLSLSNSMAEFETTRRIADELANSPLSVRDEINWRRSSGLASANLYLLNKKEQDADAGIKSLDRCCSLVENNIDKLNLFGNGEDSYMTITSYFGSCHKRAELIRDAKKDYLTAAKLFKATDDFFTKHMNDDMREFFPHLEYYRELQLSSSMLSYAKAGKINEADQMFEMVQNLPAESRRYSPGWHLNDLLSAEYPERGIKYQEKLTLWIAAHPDDSFRHILLGNLAYNQYHNKLYNSAIQTFNQLLNDYEDQAAENKSVKASVREACYTLVNLNMLVGQKEEAVQMAERFKMYADPDRPKDMERVEELNNYRELYPEGN